MACSISSVQSACREISASPSRISENPSSHNDLPTGILRCAVATSPRPRAVPRALSFACARGLSAARPGRDNLPRPSAFGGFGRATQDDEDRPRALEGAARRGVSPVLMNEERRCSAWSKGCTRYDARRGKANPRRVPAPSAKPWTRTSTFYRRVSITVLTFRTIGGCRNADDRRTIAGDPGIEEPFPGRHRTAHGHAALLYIARRERPHRSLARHARKIRAGARNSHVPAF